MALDLTGGFVINPKTVSFIIALVTLCGLLIGSITWINSYMFRVEVLETQQTEFKTTIGKLTDQIDKLNDKIVNLTIAINSGTKLLPAR